MQAKLNQLAAGIRQVMIGNLTAAQFNAVYGMLTVGNYQPRYTTETPQKTTPPSGTPNKA